jgi:type IV secretion system protein VirB8
MLNLEKIKSIFKFSKTGDDDDFSENRNLSNQTNGVKVARNWYEEKFDKIIVQRNILLILAFVLLALSIVSIISVVVVVNLRKFDPFVIQIDETTGMAKIVNPISSDVLDGNDALARYFIKKYIIARETYNPVDFDTEARKVVRLYSTNGIYSTYLGYIRNPQVDPTITYGQKNTTFLIVKSWSKLNNSSNKYMVRFSINETAENKRTFNRLAVVDFQYSAMELTEDQRDINPIGFQVTGYRVDDDNS